MEKIALITGATAGIGKATAYKFAENGWNVIITGRRKERLSEISNGIKSRYNVEVLGLHFDVRDKNEVAKAFSHLPEHWKNIDLLVNNAGLASGLDEFHEGDLEDWDKMIDTNVKGLLYVSRAITPLMVERKHGHVINIGSIAGKEVYPKGAVYTASKHAVEAITQGMRMDLLQHNIKVSAICPGLVETEFSLVRFHGDEDKAKKVYEGFQPLKGEDIADTIFFMANAPAHVNIADVVILAAKQATATMVDRGNE